MDLDELKLRLQNFLTDGLLIVIGSGLSCAEGLPGMGALADHLCARVGPGLSTEDQAIWKDSEPLIRSKGLEPALIERPPTITLEAAIVRETAALIAAHEKIVMTEVFSGKRVLRLTNLVPHIIKPASGIPIITTNYDRLAEIAIEEANLGVDTMFVGRYAGRLDERESRLSFCRDVTLKNKQAIFHFQHRAVVFKPHGSLDWYLRNDKPVHYSGELEDASRLIITPGYNKFRNGYESPFDHHRAKANDAIDRAARYLVLGYGFNDDHLETHLTPAIRSGKPALLLTRSLTTTAENIAKRHSNVIALDFAERSSVRGTRAIADSIEHFSQTLNSGTYNCSSQRYYNNEHYICHAVFHANRSARKSYFCGQQPSDD